MGDFVDRENGDHVDLLTVVYRAVEFPGSRAEATVVLVVDGGVALDRVELRRQIERLHFGRDHEGQPFHQPYTLSESYHHTSWGADGATLEFIVQVASYAVSGIVGGAAWDGLKAIGHRIGKANDSTGQAPSITEAVAVRRAIDMATADLKDVKADDLTLLSVHLSGDTATVVLRASDGSTITAHPSLFDGGAIGAVTRSYTGDDGKSVERDLPDVKN